MAGAVPQVVVLAGPNGAGKTTSSRTIVAETLSLLKFVNADVIAQGLAGFDPASEAVAAGRVMLQQLRDLAAERVSFAFETTLSSRTFAPFLADLRTAGYYVRLYYFWLADPDLAVARVALRVRRGGHHVPEDDVRRRYSRSIRNFFTLYRPLADLWEVYETTVPDDLRLIGHNRCGLERR
ncbi:MAG: zeta toxin family protein [Gemmataceae bacterium]